MTKSKSVSASAEAQKLIEKCSRASFFPSSVWWNGPGDLQRPTAEPDQYGVANQISRKAWKDDGRETFWTVLSGQTMISSVPCERGATTLLRRNMTYVSRPVASVRARSKNAVQSLP